MTSPLLWPIDVIAAVLAAWAISLIWRGVIGVRKKPERRCPACHGDTKAVDGLTCPACSHVSSAERELRASRGQSLGDVGLGVLAMAAAVGALVSKALARMWVRGGPFTVDWTELAFQCLFGGFFAMTIWTIALAIRGDRSRGRARCPHCWYSMTGAESLKCPECGREAPSPQALFRTRRRWKRAAGLASMFLVIAGATWCVPIAIKHGVVALVPTRVLIWGVAWVPDDWIDNSGPAGDRSLLGRVQLWDTYHNRRQMPLELRMALLERCCMLLPRLDDPAVSARIDLVLEGPSAYRLAWLGDAERKRTVFLSESAISAIWKAVEGSNPRAHEYAAGFLFSYPEAMAGRGQAVEALLRHPSPHLQLHAIRAIFAKPEGPADSQMTDALHLLETSTDYFVTRALANHLAATALHDPRVHEVLRKMAFGTSAARAITAARALAGQPELGLDIVVPAIAIQTPPLVASLASAMLFEYDQPPPATEAAVRNALLRRMSVSHDRAELIRQAARLDDLFGLYMAALAEADPESLAPQIDSLARDIVEWRGDSRIRAFLLVDHAALRAMGERILQRAAELRREQEADWNR